MLKINLLKRGIRIILPSKIIFKLMENFHEPRAV